MPIAKLPTRVLVLGATGKVATLLRRYWDLNPPENIELFWASRRKEPRVTHVWSPGTPVGPLPQCNAILALWGTVSGSVDALANNIALAKEAHRVGEALGADRILHASSIAVYAPQDDPITEDTPPNPRNDYGASKHAMEQAVADLSPKAVCLRIGNVVGADSLFASLTRTETPRLDQFPDGFGPVRGYLRIETLAASVEAIATSDLETLPCVINVADASPIDMADILRAAGRDFDWKPAPDGATPCMQMEMTRLVGVLGHPLEPVDAHALVAEWRRLRDRS
ncbi:NAD-dependent epimerase/dehydratase family protein [Primorskyibacter aestuariivivens]|uniref:NAD-dependent epimerase/dehydratase family protein n=1 Tax=Primorskyibacter aestuariivivens TaxID=1888912 RepID=UPI0023006F09|nr:NAD-dependent epimerase/dehydratase family protein [Primorskyibacter aestuariivivens]MDA7427670.1 NAD-dependent epimerase/dehydratase family protein [Primorskyibacter aestuariivivens]